MDKNAHLRTVLTELCGGDTLPSRLVRFAGIGGVSSLVYVVVVALFVEFLSLEPVSASILGYVISIPVGFLGHRRVTFRSDGHFSAELTRFIFLHCVNIAVSVTGMYGVVDWYGASYWFGSLFAVVFVPISSFIIMNQWVFRSKPPSK